MAGSKPGDEAILDSFFRLCTLVPKAEDRCVLLGVTTDIDAAWRSGSQLPLLRAKRGVLQRTLQSPRTS